MYIEFQLLNDDPNYPVNYVSGVIYVHLMAWAEKYKIKYRTKAFKYTIRATFDSDEHYTLFAMTWNPDQFKCLKYHLIEPMKTRQH